MGPSNKRDFLNSLCAAYEGIRERKAVLHWWERKIYSEVQVPPNATEVVPAS